MNYPPGTQLNKYNFIAARIDKIMKIEVTAGCEEEGYEKSRATVEGMIAAGLDKEKWQDPPEDLGIVFFQYVEEIDLGEI